MNKSGGTKEQRISKTMSYKTYEEYQLALAEYYQQDLEVATYCDMNKGVFKITITEVLPAVEGGGK